MAYEAFLRLLGQGVRGSKFVLGTAACEKQIKYGDIYMLILDESLSEKTKKKFGSLCVDYSVELVMMKEGDFMERTGMSYGIIGVKDRQFADALADKLGQ